MFISYLITKVTVITSKYMAGKSRQSFASCLCPNTGFLCPKKPRANEMNQKIGLNFILAKKLIRSLFQEVTSEREDLTFLKMYCESFNIFKMLEALHKYSVYDPL